MQDIFRLTHYPKWLIFLLRGEVRWVDVQEKLCRKTSRPPKLRAPFGPVITGSLLSLRVWSGLDWTGLWSVVGVDELPSVCLPRGCLNKCDVSDGIIL